MRKVSIRNLSYYSKLTLHKIHFSLSPPGCGKSTLIPQLICDAKDLIPDDKVIVCTQPRRVAAITLPEYVARDRGQELGDEVGYQIRFVNEFCEHTRLIYATTAIVLRRLHAEPDLESIGCLIVDEVHERDVRVLG
jgi:ATP-dependent helicase HrpB